MKKPEIPEAQATPRFLSAVRATLQILTGRRDNALTPVAQSALAFSNPPTQAEVKALYAYVNKVNAKLNEVILRLDE